MHTVNNGQEDPWELICTIAFTAWKKVCKNLNLTHNTKILHGSKAPAIHEYWSYNIFKLEVYI